MTHTEHGMHYAGFHDKEWLGNLPVMNNVYVLYVQRVNERSHRLSLKLSENATMKMRERKILRFTLLFYLLNSPCFHKRRWYSGEHSCLPSS